MRKKKIRIDRLRRKQAIDWIRANDPEWANDPECDLTLSTELSYLIGFIADNLENFGYCYQDGHIQVTPNKETKPLDMGLV